MDGFGVPQTLWFGASAAPTSNGAAVGGGDTSLGRPSPGPAPENPAGAPRYRFLLFLDNQWAVCVLNFSVGGFLPSNPLGWVIVGGCRPLRPSHGWSGEQRRAPKITHPEESEGGGEGSHLRRNKKHTPCTDAHPSRKEGLTEITDGETLTGSWHGWTLG